MLPRFSRNLLPLPLSPAPSRVAKRVPLRVVSYVNVHPSVRRVYRSSLGNAKFTAAITGLIFFVLSLNHVRSSPPRRL